MASKAQAQQVPAADVAAHLGTNVEQVLTLAAQQGATVTEDWRGRPCITDTVARRIREGREAEEREELRLRSEHDGWLKDRAARKSAVLGEVRLKMVGRNALVVTPASSAAVHSAQQEALQEFDEREPELDFYSWKDRKEPSMKGAR